MYFISYTDAVVNGLSTLPPNIVQQPRMNFPRFKIRDMVTSEAGLVTEMFGISTFVKVIGASMDDT